MADDRPLDEQILFRIENDVAWITINRPERGNAITPECRDRIRHLLEGLNGHFDARAVVLTAAGEKMFCPGADISTDRVYPARPEGAPDLIVGEPRRMMLEGQLRLVPAIMDCELPVIAAVNGTAAGVGVHIALACDLVIMADSAKFIEVFARRGLIPDGLGAWLLPKLIGPHKTKELMFFAEDVSAAKAHEMGLCNAVVPSGELIDRARAWAERLASGPTRAFMMTKFMVNKGLDADRDTMAQMEAWLVEANNGAADAQEGVNAFRERRDPVWRGF